MFSSVAGHQYDIFISYRHKDNKYDGWVTEFASNLRNELEATFKRELSIYFDQNAHDGIGETHDVADSLRDKVRCMVFIPILSRTYCDPDSFAWKYEFLAFRDYATHDGIGLKVKLNNGNVSSRILPIRIHELEPDDHKLFEAEAGSVLRPIDFIYTSSGVNRPLRSHEDEPRENQSHTFYRDQINKVAICIREIVGAVTKAENPQEKVAYIAAAERPVTKRASRTRAIIAAVVIALLSIGYFIYYRFQSNTPAVAATSGSAPSSIAVLPFVNISNDPEQEYFSDGVTVQIITDLSQLKDVKVIARASVMKYKNMSRSIAEIGKELDVTHVLEGSVRKSGENLRVTAQLISVADQSQLWSEDYNTKVSDLFAVQDQVSMKIAKSLRFHLKNEAPLSLFARPSNAQAYEHYLKGFYIHANYYHLSGQRTDFLKAESEFIEAIRLDTLYASAYAGLADLYDTHLPRAFDPEHCLKLRDSLAAIAYRLDPASSYSLLVKSFTFWNKNVGNVNVEEPDSIFKYILMAYRRSPNDHNVCEEFAFHLKRNGLNEKALEFAEQSIALNPLSSNGHSLVAGFYVDNGNFDRAEYHLQRALLLESDNIVALTTLAALKIFSGELTQAEEVIERIRPLSSRRANIMENYRRAANGQREALDLNRDELVYTFLGMKDEAIDYLTKNRKDYLYLRDHPVLVKLHDEPRFQTLLAAAREEYEQKLKRFSFSNISG